MKYTLALILFTSLNLMASFIENQGQFPPNVQFLFIARDANVWITDNDIIFDYKAKSNDKFLRTTIKLHFLNHTNFQVSQKIATRKSINYLVGNINSLPNVFDTIKIQNLYDAIDLILYSKNGLFAYDFFLKPYANPNLIKFSLQGADNIIAKDNQLQIFTSNVIQYHDNLSTFYEGSKQIINSKFIIHDKIIKFELGNYNRKEAIRIDPVVYSTYFGGSSFDYLRSVGKDSSGNIIIVGRTRSADYPVKIGSLDTTFSDIGYDFYDAVITKLSPNADSVIFSTFLGGMGDDYAESVALDKFGNIYITGYTFSLRSFPFTSNALDTFDIGGYDGFLTILNPQGNSLIFSTLFGGVGDDYPQSIVLDRNRNIYITGYTTSADFRTTRFAFDTVFNTAGISNNKNDAFAMKFTNNFQLSYSTYIGGSGDDFGQSITVDSSGNAIIAGITRSSDFPVSSFAFQKNIGDSIPQNSTGDGFVIKLNANGSDKIFSTFFGGFGRDAIYSTALDSNSNIYIAGYTESQNLPYFPKSFQNKYNNINTGTVAGDAFIAKLKYSGDTILSCTYLGGTGSERIASISLDKFNFPLVCGFTTSRDLPITNNAFQKNYIDSTDSFVARLTPQLDYSTYLTYIGGRRNDIANSIIPADSAFALVAGFTNSTDFPTTPNAIQNIPYDNLSNMFLAKIFANYISLDFNKYLGTRLINICHGDSIFIGILAFGGIGKISYNWSPSDGVSIPDSSHTFIKPIRNQTYYLTASDEYGNTAIDSITIIVHNKPNISLNGSTMVLTNSIEEYTLSTDVQGFADWFVSQGNILEQTNKKLKVRWSSTPKTGSIKVVFTSTYGCIDSTTILVRIGNLPRPKIKYTGKFPPCSGDTLILDAGAGYYSYFWSTGDTTRTIAITQNGKYFVRVSDSLGFVGISDTLNVYFMTYPTPQIYGLTTVKPGMIYEYYVEGSPGSTFTWIINGGVLLSEQGNDTISVRWNYTNKGSIIVQETTREGCTVFSEIFNVEIGGAFKPKIRVLGSTDICQGDSVLLDAGYGFSYYQWNNGSNKRFIFVSTAGKFFCYVRDNYGYEGFTDTITTRILERPPKPGVRVLGNQFTCLIDSLPIQWYYNDQIIPNATSTKYIADLPGLYKVCVRGYNGCQSCSDAIPYLVSVSNEIKSILIYPNPCKDNLNILLPSNSEKCLQIQIYNILHENVHTVNCLNNYSNQINISFLPPGAYFIYIISNSIYYRNIFIKD